MQGWVPYPQNGVQLKPADGDLFLHEKFRTRGEETPATLCRCHITALSMLAMHSTRVRLPSPARDLGQREANLLPRWLADAAD